MTRTKKIISLIITALLLLTLSVNTYAADEISVYVDNTKVKFDVPPQIIGGRTMVPLRAIFESLGATVNWDASTRTITAYNITTVVKATIDSNIISVNYVDKTMDVAPMIINDRTLVPARFVAEAFGCNVDWNGNTKTVTITSAPVDYNELEKDTSSSSKTPDTGSTDSNKTQETYSSSTVVHNEYSFEPTRKFNIVCTNIIRGSEANSIINSENMFNDKPSSSQEWIIMEFNVDYLSSSDGNNDEIKGSDIIYKDTFFLKNKSSLPVYDLATLGDRYGAYGVFDVRMYPGSSAKIVIGLLTDKNVGDLLLKVPNKSANTSSWIECSGNGSSGISSVHSEKQKETTTDSSFYPGTSIPTYTSVTGIRCKASDTLSSGTPLYRYKFTSSDDVSSYWNKLVSLGWSLLQTDDKTTTDVFESGFASTSGVIVVNVYWDINEVWISFE